MRAMTDPQSGTRAYRIDTARTAIAAYEAWIADDDLAPSPPFETIGKLVTCARWLLDTMEGAPPGTFGPRVTGLANTAVKHLDTRAMRDVLNILAKSAPAAVLAAIEESRS